MNKFKSKDSFKAIITSGQECIIVIEEQNPSYTDESYYDINVTFTYNKGLIRHAIAAESQLIGFKEAYNKLQLIKDLINE